MNERNPHFIRFMRMGNYFLWIAEGLGWIVTIGALVYLFCTQST